MSFIILEIVVNIEEHKREDIRTNGDCCFNHIIGLPQKDGIDKPMYDYEKIIFDSLAQHLNVRLFSLMIFLCCSWSS
jgi:hypothetical protein